MKGFNYIFTVKLHLAKVTKVCLNNSYKTVNYIRLYGYKILL